MARMIRDWTDSEKVDQLSSQAEVFFIRLCMKADDYGSFHGNPKLVKASLYPLRSDSLREADITRWMAECQKAGLLFFYQADSKPFVRIMNFGQRLRNKKKRFPDVPDGFAASCGELRPEENRTRIELEEKVNTDLVYDAEKSILASPIQLEQIIMRHGIQHKPGMEALRKYHLHLEEKEQYPKTKKAVLAGFEKWLMNEKKFSGDTDTKKMVH